MDMLMFGIILIVLLVFSLFVFFVSRLQTVPPSEALVISGSNDKEARSKIVHPGGRVFVIPIFQSSVAIPLTQMSLGLEVEGVDANSIPIRVRATANIKVGNEPSDIRQAAERFGDSKNITQAIEFKVTNVLLGSLRTIVAEMTVEDLLMKRAKLSEAVKENAGSILKPMGLVIDSLTVDQITDPNGYIEALSVPETQRVLKAARIAEAEAEKEAKDAEVESQVQIAQKQKDLEIKRSEILAETEKARAISAAAGPLAEAEQEERIAKMEQKAAVERANLRASELDREVNRPADAAKYARKQEAEAEKSVNIAIAEAEAEAIKIKGLAEAEAIREKGLAEAEAMEKKAEAYEKYGPAAVLDLTIKQLPQIAKELAAPMSNIDNMTVVGTDGAGAVTKTVSNGFSELNALLKGFTGVDLMELISKNNTDTKVLETINSTVKDNKIS